MTDTTNMTNMNDTTNMTNMTDMNDTTNMTNTTNMNDTTNMTDNTIFDEDDEDEDEDKSTISYVIPKPIDSTFAFYITKIKHHIYQAIVLPSSDLDNPDIQNIDLLQKYLDTLKNVYDILLESLPPVNNMDTNKIKKSMYPKHSIKYIFKSMKWINQFYNTNSYMDVVPYEHFIKNHFIVYPWVQTSYIV
jgi:hypothetical protein